MYGKKYLVFKLDVVFFSSYRWSTALSLSRHLNFKFYQHTILIRNINTNIFHCNIFVYIFGQKYYTISLLTLERIEWHLTHARCDYAVLLRRFNQYIVESICKNGMQGILIDQTWWISRKSRGKSGKTTCRRRTAFPSGRPNRSGVTFIETH